MKKIVLFILLTTLTLFSVGCGSEVKEEGNNQPEEISFSVNDVFVDYRGTAEIQTDLPEEYAGNVTYEYDSADISVDGGLIYGLTPGATATVYATYSGKTVPFKVTVNKIFGKNGSSEEYGNCFYWTGNGSFLKNSETQGNDFIYLNGAPLNDAEYCNSGALEISNCVQGGEADILIKQDAENYLKYSFLYAGGNSYKLTVSGSLSPKSEDIRILNSGKVNYAVMVRQGASYLFLDNLLVNKTELNFDKPHLGFGGSKCTVKLSRLYSTRSHEDVERVYKTASKAIGYHCYGTGSSSPREFKEYEDGIYVKSSYSYAQAFVYVDCVPVAGTKYWLEGKLELITSDVGGNAVILMAQSDTEQLRYVLENYEKDKYRIFRDKVTAGAFNSYQIVTETSSTINFRFVYDNAYTYLYLDGKLVNKSECSLGQTHLGFAGDRCEFAVSNLIAGYDVL